MRLLLCLGIFLGGVRAVLAAAASPSDAAFEAAAKAFIEDYLRLNPEEATDLGDHRYDDKLREYSPEALVNQIATWKKHLAALDRIDAKGLTGANRIDARIMRVNLQAMLFELTAIKSSEWNPLFYNASL